MRRSLAAVLVTLATAVTAMPVLSTTADASAPTAIPRTTPGQDDPAHDALQRAVRAFAPVKRERTTGPSARPDATLALRDLFGARARLSDDDRLQADRLLARPTDGAADPYQNGYTVPSTRKCSRKVCLHWVNSTADAPPSKAWAMTSLRMMDKVWRYEVGRLGYRKPRTDRRHSSGPKFDVYLKELGNQFIYGYCAPEYLVPGTRRVASGFCVLDNDFAKAQFGAPPLTSLRVTAAHEFFHAIQFGYDFREDTWLMESTATWMEEQFADSANDNRRYLPYGQVAQPQVPLDLSQPNSSAQYGNWAFWEYLSRRHGRSIVKKVWQKAGAYRGAGRRDSTPALKAVLRSRGGFPKVFSAYASANTIPARTYPEGKAWPAARATRITTLGRSTRTTSLRTRVDHMAAKHVVLRPDSTLKGKKWRLRIKVTAPRRAVGGRAYLIVKTTRGKWVRRPVALNRKGRGVTSIAFSRRTTRSAILTLVNTSTRFRCRQNQPYTCAGTPRADNRLFTVKATVRR
ncbi:MXAN_6640 family putative metalloprotease [Nocardioides lijunqiniae]|uniref:MXAN_6640 family putative metalloprotease n=1 Tax=Nocardioides lijunqiniae TaxID=2760832 RepID=UPI00187784AC|nr:MXAN_6640 family putative metalloprotease [Nocardioides lijunqiniae]